MFNVFQRKTFVRSMSQVRNFGRLLCSSKFESQHKNQEVNDSGRIFSAALVFQKHPYINFNGLIKFFC